MSSKSPVYKQSIKRTLGESEEVILRCIQTNNIFTMLCALSFYLEESCV